jgi:hypothetical protein
MMHSVIRAMLETQGFMPEAIATMPFCNSRKINAKFFSLGAIATIYSVIRAMLETKGFMPEAIATMQLCNSRKIN